MGETYIAEDAEQDVDDGVGGADAALDPDCGEMVLAFEINEAITMLAVATRIGDQAAEQSP